MLMTVMLEHVTGVLVPQFVVLSIPSPSESVWHLGPVPIRGYALSIILGIVAAIWIGEKRWVARGGRPGEVADVSVWAVPFGVIGGRIYHVITDWHLYFGADGSPVEALYIWRGGLGVWGAISFGAVGVLIACRLHGIKMLPMADALAPGVLVAQAIGRWGNWFNQELFGRPTDLPWALKIDPDFRPPRLRGVRDLPPGVPLRVRVEPARLRRDHLARPPLPARPRPCARALRDGLHPRPRLDRDAPHRHRPDGRRPRPPAQRVDLDRAVRRRRGVLLVGRQAGQGPRGVGVRRRRAQRGGDDTDTDSSAV